MFESAELGQALSDEVYKKAEPELRAALLATQYELGQAKSFSALILISGLDGAGKGETVHTLNEWMDPRHIDNVAFDDEPSDEEAARPPMWRYWRALPPKGKIGILFGSWYTEPLVEQAKWGKRAQGKLPDNAIAQRIEEILRFERMLCDEGTLILKFWFHLSKSQQKKRLKQLESHRETRWRVTQADWKRYKLYDETVRAASEVLRETSTGDAPWIAIEGWDSNYRELTAGRVLLDAMRRRLNATVKVERRVSAAPVVPAVDNLQLLGRLDLSQKLDDEDYDRQLERLQGKLNRLTRDRNFARHSLALAFEGWDAAGKGGAIRRVTAALDPRRYRIDPVSAPNEVERAYPYLWRFWAQVPRRGGITIFDRSWYGRVLVERVEGLCSEADWMRAYGEINDFEEQLCASGAIILKFWLQISRTEQLRRFKAREETPYKRFKITPDDWRNRKKWRAYERAVCDMVDRTSSEFAPWTLVEAEDKNFARIKVIETIVDRLEAAL